MAKKIGGLGKGLGAFGLNKTPHPAQTKTENTAAKKQPAASADSPATELNIGEISVNPHQPRTEFTQASIDSLQDSIKQYGVLQPVLVRKTVKGYELIAGERRLRAAKQAGLTTIPAIVREYNDAQMTEVALIENIQRENLNPVEEAQAYQHLLSDYGLTQDMLSRKIGRSRSHIANFLRLLNLTREVQQMLTEEKLAMGQAKPLLALDDEELQNKAAAYILENDLTARKAEQLVKVLQKNPHYLDDKDTQEKAKSNPQQDVLYQEAQDKLKMLLGTGVRIKQSGKKQKLEIDFATAEDLTRLIEMLEKLAVTAARVQEVSKEDKLAMLRQFSTTGKLTV